jgi:hypothetical protein
MILQVLLGVAAILGAGLFALQGTQIASGIVGELIAPITLMVEKTFTILGYLAPILVAIIPLYLVLQSKGKQDNRLLGFSALYGVLLFAFTAYMGLGEQLIQAMRSSFFVGSTLGLAVSTLGVLADWVLGIFTGLLYWGIGFALVLLDGLLDTLVGVGEAAKHGKRGIRGAQHSIIDRIGGKR